MSIAEIERFAADLKSNAALRAEAEAQADKSHATPIDRAVAFAATKGYAFTADQAKEHAEGEGQGGRQGTHRRRTRRCRGGYPISVSRFAADLKSNAALRAEAEKAQADARNNISGAIEGRHPRIQSLEPAVERRQRGVRQPPDRPQRMISRDTVLQPHVGEQRLGSLLAPRIDISLRCTNDNGIIYRHQLPVTSSAAC